MRVAIFLDAFPLISETFILRQITGLLDLGHEVDIYADREGDSHAPVHPQVREYSLLSRTTYMNMPMAIAYELPVWPVTGRTWLPGTEEPVYNAVRLIQALPTFVQCARITPALTLQALNPFQYGYQAQSLSALYRLSAISRKSRRKRYDVLHVHFGPVANSFRFVRHLLKAPLVVSFHGYDFGVWPRKEGQRVYTRLFRIADAITVNSDYTRSRLAALGCPPGKLHKLPVGVDLQTFPFHERVYEPGKPVRILTVGRLVEKKGIEYSIRAVAFAREKHPALHYDIVGDGPMRSDLETLIRHLGVQDVVTLHGAQDSITVRQMMDQAHIFILASVTASDGDEEGQGLVLQEAQSSGLPVLATQHDGFSESIVPDQSGFLVPERDISALSDRLTYLIEHPELWPQMGRAGRKHVEAHYDIHVLNRQLAALYRRVIKGYRTGHTRA